MSQTKSLCVLAGAALSLGGAAFAQGDAWTTQSTDEVRAIVAEMMADAETRSSLLQSGGTAGHDGKFFLASPDGNFRLNIGGQVQFRYALNFVDSTNPASDDFEQGFQTRRTKLEFSGHIFQPGLFYKVVGAFDRGNSGGNFDLEDAYFGYQWDNGFSVRWGQFKLPFLREELVSSKYQLMVDRSVTNEIFNQDRSQGIELSYEAEMWRFFLAFSDGFNSDNTDYAVGAGGATGLGEADYAFTGRVEFLFSGDWKQFRDFTSWRGSDFGMMLGAAAHFEDSPDTTAAAQPAGNDEFLAYTIDLSFEGDGWNLYGAFVGNHVENDTPGAPEVDNFGFVVQGGLFLTDELELAARFDMVIPDDQFGPGTDDEFSTITAGINYYMHKHAAKFSLDVAYYLDDSSQNFLVGATDPDTGINRFGGGAGGEDEVAIRAQFQLLF